MGSTKYQYLFHKTDVVTTGLVDGKTLKPVDFLGARVSVQLQQFYAKVSVTHHYRNRESAAINAVFAFPLEDAWTVSAFTAEMKGQNVLAKVKKREQMEKEFRDGVFIASLPGPVKPNEQLSTTITFLMELTHAGNEFQFQLKKSVIPHKPVLDSTDWKNMFEVPFASKLPRSIYVSVDVDMDGTIAEVQSLTHKMAFSVRDKHVTGVFEQPFSPQQPVTLSDDLVVAITLREEPELMKVAMVKEISASVPDDKAFAFNIPIVPQFSAEDLATPNTEAVFVVDCSGSMASTIGEVERIVKLALQGLPQSVPFNVILFGDTTQILEAEGCIPFTNNNLLSARAFVHNLQADMGGTNILAAMKVAYGLPLRRGYCRQVFLITDGAVNKPYELLRLVKFNANTTRVFTFALDVELKNRELFETLSASSGGSALFVGGSDDLSTRILTTIQGALQPALTMANLTFSYEGGPTEADSTAVIPPITTTANTLPLLFNAKRCLISAFGARSLVANPVVTLSAWVGDRQMEWAYHIGDFSEVQISNNESGRPEELSILHSVAAINRIRELTEFNPKSATTAAEEAEVTALSETFNLISPYTSYSIPDAPADSSIIACEYSYLLPRDERNFNKVDRPRPLPAGEGTIRPQTDPDFIAPPSSQQKPRSTIEFMRSVVDDIVHTICRSPTIDDVVFTQAATGNWILDEHFAQNLDIPYLAVQETVPVVPSDISLMVPAIKERDRRLEEERRKKEEAEAEKQRKEEEIAAKKAQKEMEIQRQKAEARSRMTDEELAALEEAERRKSEEEAEKAKQEADRAEKERREREKEEERTRKRKEAERKKLVKKLGEEAVRQQEELDAHKELEEQERKRREEESALKREEDSRLAWELNERLKYIGNVWASAVALAYLRLQYSDKEHEYIMVWKRGHRWLTETGVPEVEQWPEKAEQWLQPILAEREEVRRLEVQLRQEAMEIATKERDAQTAQTKRVESEASKRAAVDTSAEVDTAPQGPTVDTSDEETEQSRLAALRERQEQERLAKEAALKAQQEEEVEEPQTEMDHLTEGEGEADGPVDEEDMPEDGEVFSGDDGDIPEEETEDEEE